jgi:hypothetical protein
MIYLRSAKDDYHLLALALPPGPFLIGRQNQAGATKSVRQRPDQNRSFAQGRSGQRGCDCECEFRAQALR